MRGLGGTQLQVEREDLAIAERVESLAEQARAEVEAVAPVSEKVAGRAVPPLPHRSDAADEGALPGHYRKALAILPEAFGRCRSGRLASGWAWTRRCAADGAAADEDDQARRPRLVHKRPAGRFTARP
ncbi:hypothetical protein [Streptomyces sp. NPDC047706]|uniref:hypothetical protein n=1 Tax=Streptomyces sp. NPDC047706 TaxID=3365486 RepID=UPI003723617B